MRKWAGEEKRFFPHAAQHDFEAWLLPYWETIQKLAGHNKTAPSGNPELVNHNKPPASHIKEIFEAGKCRDSYVKPRDVGRILKEKDLRLFQNFSSWNSYLEFSGKTGQRPVFPRACSETNRVLEQARLSIAINQCAELKAFVDRIISLSV